jgi:hypothetical protein
MRTHMLDRTSIIAQTISVQGDKKYFATVMLVNYAGSRGRSSRSSTTFRTTRRPPPDTSGLGWFRLGSAATVRLVRLAGGLALMACNQLSTRFTARRTSDWVHRVCKSLGSGMLNGNGKGVRTERKSVCTFSVLREEHERTIVPAQALARETLDLEQQVSAVVNAAYGLTPEEVSLMWETAPPRMPIPGAMSG